jgi:hypothetical protein
MSERKVFWFLRSYYEAAKELPKESQADFFMAVCSYALDGIEPEIHGVAGAMFQLARPNIEMSLKRSDAGRTRKQKGNKTETNTEQNVNKTETNDEQNGNPLMSNEYMNNELMNNDVMSNELMSNDKPVRHKYGQYNNVLLSDKDMEKLKDEFPFDWAERIEKVSEYCASHGKTYKNYLATIRNWARMDKKSPAQDSYNKVLDLLEVDDG